MIRCINVTLEHRGYVSLGAIVPGLLLSEMKGRTVESMTTFDSTKESLQDLLQSIREGQRPNSPTSNAAGSGTTPTFVACWRASPSLPHRGGDDAPDRQPRRAVQAPPGRGRPPPVPPSEPERLILDGQQRLTSLFQALLWSRRSTKDARDKLIKRWYYIDIARPSTPTPTGTRR